MRIGDYIAKKTNSELCDIMPSSVLDYIFTDGFIDYDNEIGTKTEYSPLTHVFKDSNIEIEFTGNGTLSLVIRYSVIHGHTLR